MHDDRLKFLSEQLNEFCKRQGLKTHEIAELSLSLWGKVDVKTAYLVGREFFQIKNSKNKGYSF